MNYWRFVLSSLMHALGNLDECTGQLNKCDALLVTSKQQIAGYEHQVEILDQQLAERASFTWWLKLPLFLIKRVFKANN